MKEANWNLAAYGKIIRGDENTSEDQIAEAVTPEIAKLLVDKFNSPATTKIQIGSIFKYRHNGQHEDCKLVILHDEKLNRRILYNMTYKTRIGDSHLFYAEFTGERLTKKEIKDLQETLNERG